ncbi:hypothetical protein [Inquilinus limosus]|uniref:hypothetical protein n=1 Tax=Inquilinus limosus TaxID=171674 RepID=UPI00041FE830|nr:hypothetical protein [Inquilinus limosus]
MCNPFKPGDIVKFKRTKEAQDWRRRWFPDVARDDRLFVSKVSGTSIFFEGRVVGAGPEHLTLAARPSEAPKEEPKVYFVARCRPSGKGFGMCPLGPMTKAEAIAVAERNAKAMNLHDRKYVVLKVAAEVTFETTHKTIVKDIG